MIRCLKRPLVLVFSLFMSFIAMNSMAQGTKKAVISGEVINEKKEALPGANVIIPTLQIGATTDENGRFELQVEPQSLTMTVSFIGYSSMSIRVDKQELLKKGNLELKIELIPIAQEIGAVTVVGEKRIAVVEETRESVLDFEFLDDELLVLISNKRGYRIQRFTEDLQSKGAMYLQEKPEGFFKDCFGGVHIRYRSHADELEFMGKNLGVKSSYDILKFRQLLSPCIVATDEDIYFRTTELSNQKITYFAKNRESKRSRILHVVEEKERLAMINGTREHVADLKRRLSTESFATPSDRLEIERDIQQYEWFDQAILSQVTYHPLFLNQDSLFVFDHFQGGLFVYDKNGGFVRGVPIDYHMNKDWAKLVLMDELNGRFYVDIARSGISVLYHFDPSNGNYKASLVIEDHTFPEKMKIRNNRVWYIHQDLNQDAPALYVMDIPIE